MNIEEKQSTESDCSVGEEFNEVRTEKRPSTQLNSYHSHKTFVKSVRNNSFVVGPTSNFTTSNHLQPFKDMPSHAVHNEKS